LGHRTKNPRTYRARSVKGLTLSAAIVTLANNGFEFKSATKGGYQTFEHPDGSVIHIRPNGEIVRTGPKIQDMNGKTYRRRYEQNGNQIQFVSGANTHNTGEKLIL
jgi:beta-lactam-binding protein with PASTA domain